MKKLLVIFLFLFFIQPRVFSQSCLPEGITFLTQTQIDSFQINYPNCTEIEGNVIIEDGNTTSVTNLNGLSILTTIEGNLVITNNDFLGSLTGLNALISIGGDIEIKDNAVLLNFMGLDNLISIGGSLQIYDNDNLNSLDGLENLSSVEGDLIIGHINTLYGGNPSLTNISSLSMLSSIGGALRVSNNNAIGILTGLENIAPETIYDLYIDNNSSLYSCEAESICNYLSNPNGILNIENNAPGCNSIEEVIEACDGICLPFGITFTTQEEIDNFQANHPNCYEIAGNVTISGVDINNLNGLEAVTSVWGNLGIGGNASLNSLTGLENLNTIEGNLLIVDNDLVSNFNGLVSLTTIEGNLKVADNDALVSFSGLENLALIGFHFRIINNSNLSDLAGLSSITYVMGDLDIYNNDNLEDLSGLSSVEAVVGNLKIRDNDFLGSLTGLDIIVSIGGNFLIQDNPFLTNLLGFDNLAYTGGYELVNNDALTGLTGLQNMASIWGNLIIQDNEVLSSLAGLDSINPETISYLNISNNSALSECNIHSICDYLGLPNSIIEISENAPGCNSPEEVEEACITSVEEINTECTFTFIPNPLKSNAVITYTLNENSHVSLNILDLSGRLVVPLVNEVQQQGEQKIDFNIARLPAGIYFCVLKTNEEIQTRKIIKL